MARWNDTCELLASPKRHQDGEGNWVQGEQVARQVFCNRFTVGGATWASVVDAGLRADAEVQLRSVEYAGEDEVRFHGVEYDVTRVVDSGEFTRLTLGRRLSND